MLSVVLILSACGSGVQGSTGGTLFKDGIAEYIQTTYRLHDVVSSQEGSAEISEIYIAENQSIETVASDLQNYEKPRELSEKKDNKQVLVYDNLFVILTNDPDNPENTLVEVSDYEFVRNHYNPSFFDGLLVLWLLDDILDVDDWGKKQRQKCSNNNENCYRGYGSSGGLFKTPGTSSTVRGGTSSVRGGGPGTGK